MADPYKTMKKRALGLVQTLFKSDDPYRELMADSDTPYQPFFLTHLPTVIPEEKDRQILLDGLAREYAGLEGWMAYVDRECQSVDRECQSTTYPTKRPS